jgi:hypothetical protein
MKQNTQNITYITIRIHKHYNKNTHFTKLINIWHNCSVWEQEVSSTGRVRVEKLIQSIGTFYIEAHSLQIAYIAETRNRLWI